MSFPALDFSTPRGADGAAPRFTFPSTPQTVEASPAAAPLRLVTAGLPPPPLAAFARQSSSSSFQKSFDDSPNSLSNGRTLSVVRRTRGGTPDQRGKRGAAKRIKRAMPSTNWNPFFALSGDSSSLLNSSTSF